MKQTRTQMRFPILELDKQRQSQNSVTNARHFRGSARSIDCPVFYLLHPDSGTPTRSFDGASRYRYNAQRTAVSSVGSGLLLSRDFQAVVPVVPSERGHPWRTREDSGGAPPHPRWQRSTMVSGKILISGRC